LHNLVSLSVVLCKVCQEGDKS